MHANEHECDRLIGKRRLAHHAVTVTPSNSETHLMSAERHGQAGQPERWARLGSDGYRLLPATRLVGHLGNLRDSGRPSRDSGNPGRVRADRRRAAARCSAAAVVCGVAHEPEQRWPSASSALVRDYVDLGNRSSPALRVGCVVGALGCGVYGNSRSHVQAPTCTTSEAIPESRISTAPRHVSHLTH